MSLMAAERSSAGCSRLEEFPVEERSSLGRAVSDIDWNDFDEVSIVGITRLAVLVLIAALSLFVYTMAASEPLMFSEPMHNLFFMADQSQSGLRRPGAKQYLALCGAQVVVLVLLVGTWSPTIMQVTPLRFVLEPILKHKTRILAIAMAMATRMTMKNLMTMTKST